MRTSTAPELPVHVLKSLVVGRSFKRIIYSSVPGSRRHVAPWLYAGLNLRGGELFAAAPPRPQDVDDRKRPSAASLLRHLSQVDRVSAFGVHTSSTREPRIPAH